MNKSNLFVLSALLIVVAIAIASGITLTNNKNTNQHHAFAQSDNSDSILTKQAVNVSSLSTTVPNLGNQEAKVPNRQITLIAEDAEIEIAPGKKVKAWTFNGTVPSPTIRLGEGENVTIKFINKSPIPHTIHFHGNHDDTNDGVVPQVMPNETYLYNITGEPAGALMYHCHAPPTSLHIRMGMYGALIVDPKDKQLAPAKEFVMVLGEYSLQDQLGLEADYYLINGYADQYLKHPITINQGELLRIYLINMGTTIPAPFHLHSTTFDAYPSGLWQNEPQHVQTIPVAPGDASIIEAKWKYPGTYLFHSHGIQEERGNMGQINVIGASGTYGDRNSDGNMHGIQISNANNTLDNPSKNLSALTKTVSMFDWQYNLQNSLQKPQVINNTNHGLGKIHNNDVMKSEEIQKKGEGMSLQKDSNLATNITDTNNTEVTVMGKNNKNNNSNGSSNTNTISIVPGSGNPNNNLFYDPSNAFIKVGTKVTWMNNDNLPHTATSGDQHIGPTGEFDSGIVMAQKTFTHTFDKQGVYKYYCTIHPFMTAQVTVTK